MRRIVSLMCAALVTTAAVLTAAETTRWVERAKVDVREGRGSYYPIVDTVVKGEQVEILQTEDRWVTIKTPRGKVGWVFEAALSAKAVQPSSDSSFLRPSGGATTSRTAASQGAKGLYAQDYAKSKGYDYTVVEWVEGHQPSSNQVSAFLKDGGEPAGGRR